MATKMHFQVRNNCPGVCYVKLVNLEERGVIINCNQVLTPVKEEHLCQLFAKALMEFHGALVVLEAALA